MNGTSSSARACSARPRAGAPRSRVARARARARAVTAAAGRDPTDPTRARGTPGRRGAFHAFLTSRVRRWGLGCWLELAAGPRLRWRYWWITTTAGASARRVPGRFRRVSRSVALGTPRARGWTSSCRATRRRARCPRRCSRPPPGGSTRGRSPSRGVGMDGLESLTARLPMPVVFSGDGSYASPWRWNEEGGEEEEADDPSGEGLPVELLRRGSG